MYHLMLLWLILTRALTPFAPGVVGISTRRGTIEPIQISNKNDVLS